MGNLAQCGWRRYQGISEAKILMAGLDAAGKTTILYTLSLGPKLPPEGFNTIPTIGFNVEKVKCGKVEFTMWDTGYNPHMRALVRHYYANSQGLIFVVDASYTERLPSARNFLADLLNNDEFLACPLLIFANKQDMLAEGFDPVSFGTNLGLSSLPKDRKWYI